MSSVAVCVACGAASTEPIHDHWNLLWNQKWTCRRCQVNPTPMVALVSKLTVLCKVLTEQTNQDDPTPKGRTAAARKLAQECLDLMGKVTIKES